MFFVSDRPTHMQFRKMQNVIYGSMVTIQYHAKCTNLFTQKFTSKKIAFIFFLLQPSSGHCLCSNSNHRRVNTHLSVIAPNNVATFSTKMHRNGILQPIWQQIGSITLTTTTCIKVGVILLTESQQ